MQGTRCSLRALNRPQFLDVEFFNGVVGGKERGQRLGFLDGVARVLVTLKMTMVSPEKGERVGLR